MMPATIREGRRVETIRKRRIRVAALRRSLDKAAPPELREAFRADRRVQNFHFLFETITALGDSGFVLPASVGLAAALVAHGDRRTALALLGAVAASAILTIAAKLAFMIHGMAGVHSPSGHTSMATVFFASIGSIAARSGSKGAGRLGAAICALVIVAVAVSRVALSAHTRAETLIGVAIGLFSFGLFRAFAARRTPIGWRKLAAFLAIVLAAYAAVGASVTLEEPLERVAAYLGRMLQR